MGKFNDFAAEVPDLISSATGSFDSVTGVKSESGKVNGQPPPLPNAFSLQLNTKRFKTSVCSGSPNPACLGWQQFIYSNSSFSHSGSAFIQYWLLRYNAKECPANWTKYPVPGSTDIDCYRNGTGGDASVGVQEIAKLVQLRLTGQANSDGTDRVIITTPGIELTSAPQESMLNVAKDWHGVEFAIVGDCCGSEATFEPIPGSTIVVVVRTTVHHGNTNAPFCVMESFTGETNNLNLVGAPAVRTAPAPVIVSEQSSVADPFSPPSCVAANGVGDTHLTTFGGFLYDFQASGEFVLAQVDPDFVVQTRQVSGAPTWPNTSTNTAVATRLGKTRVAICLAPVRLEINGKTADLADGQSLSLPPPDGIDVSRRGNVYVISDQSGDSVRAEIVNASWINVSVGLGRWPVKVRGLLHGNVNEIEMRDGTVLKNPVSFTDLYHRYADSWRVPAEESMLCKDEGRERRIPEKPYPEKPFSANNLDQQHYERARAICTAAGVNVESLLDACMLDVAVLGDAAAARVFVSAPAPIAVMQPGSR